MGGQVGSKNAPKERRAYMVTLIDFEGNPVKQTMVFTNNIKNQKTISEDNPNSNRLPIIGPILNELGFEDIVKKTGMEEIVVNNYTRTRSKKSKNTTKLSTICKSPSFTFDFDAFKKGRFYLSFIPVSDNNQTDDYTGTGLDIYWVIDDIKWMQENGLKNVIGVVS